MSTNRTLPAGLLALALIGGLWLAWSPGAGLVLASDPPAGNAAQWPTLKQVIKSWQDVPVDAVQRAAETNNLEAQYYLGYCLAEGSHVPRDGKKSVAWLSRAGQAGYPPAYNLLGYMYANGLGVPQDWPSALRYYHLAADAGLARAKLNIGYMYVKGEGVAHDQAEGVRWIRAAAEQGDANAQYEMSWQAANSWGFAGTHNPLRRDAEAFRWCKLAADQNQPDAVYKLAQCYLEGRGVERDEERGVELLRQGADQYDVHAVVDLAAAYSQGIGVPRDPHDQPMQLLTRAVQRDPAEWRAYNPLIFHCEYGTDTDRDIVAAVRWWCRAAVAGADRFSLDGYVSVPPVADPHGVSTLPESEFPLISGPALSCGSSERFVSNMRLFLAAAYGKDPHRFAEIGEGYLAGRDVPNSPAKAWPWMKLAAQKGDSGAATKLAAIESSMTSDEIRDAGRALPGLVQELDAVATLLRGIPGAQIDGAKGGHP